MYGVRPESAIESEAAYDPAWACMDHDDQIAVPPGETREDNLFITGPNVWAGDDQRPLGVATGRFRLSYLVSPCLGDELRCSPDPDAAVSNEFEVVLRD